MTQEEFKNDAERLRPRMLAAARRLLGSDDDSQDAVQDVLLRLWQMVGELRRPVDGLALVLVRNVCTDRLRRSSKPPTLSAYVPGDDAPPDERLERTMAIVDSLPPLQQTILRLRHMEGMEMDAIARLTGSSEVAIRKALSRARQQVRMQYTKQYE